MANNFTICCFSTTIDLRNRYGKSKKSIKVFRCSECSNPKGRNLSDREINGCIRFNIDIESFKDDRENCFDWCELCVSETRDQRCCPNCGHCREWPNWLDSMN